MTIKKLISIVAPCFNEEENVEELHRRIVTVFAAEPNYEFELIFADNDSTDGTREIIRRIAAADTRVRAIFNVRNFGHVRSPHHAVLQAFGDAVVVMASDLQNPPEMISQFLRLYESGFKVVAAIKEQSEEASIFFIVRRFYYGLLQRLSEVQILENFTGFGLYDRVVVDILRTIPDPYPYFRGLISEIGYPVARVPFRQPMRRRGFSKNNFFTLLDVAMLGITKHSTVPIRLVTLSGFIMSAVSLFTALSYLAMKLVFWNKFDFGWAPVLIGLYFFASIQTFFIGILGEYINSIHVQVRRLPLVWEHERVNFQRPVQPSAGTGDSGKTQA